jgi:polyketide synthase PksN
VKYSSEFTGIEQVYVGEDQLLAKLSLPVSIRDGADRFVLHPILMESAVQVSALLGYGCSDLVSFSPLELLELKVLEKCNSEMWAFIRRSKDSEETDKMQKLDIDLCDRKVRYA